MGEDVFNNFTLLDGGMGRELERMGAPFRQPEWSALALIEDPSFVNIAHRNFINAGADMITTNAYAVVPFHIRLERFEAQGFDLARQAGQCAREEADAAGRDVKVAGCLPPIGGSYAPENFDFASASIALNTLIEAQDPFVDLWLAETTSSIAEAQCIAQSLKAHGSDKPFFLSYNLEEDIRRDAPIHIRSGEPLKEALSAALEIGVKAVLYNCNMPDDISLALQATQEVFRSQDVSIPYGAYANAFTHIEEDREANTVLNTVRFDLTPMEYCAYAHSWIELGAEIIGGCCAIGPDHIRALNEMRSAKRSFHHG